MEAEAKLGKEQDKPTVFVAVPMDKNDEIELRKLLFRAGLSMSEFLSGIVNSKTIKEKYLHNLINEIKNDKSFNISKSLTSDEVLTSAKIKSSNIFDLLAIKSALKKEEGK